MTIASLRAASSALSMLACAFLLAVTAADSLAQVTPRSDGKQTVRPVNVPKACTTLAGVERRICVECEGVEMFRRIGCQQRVFWTACKGKRLFEDPYCRTHQDKGPPGGEGGEGG